MGQIAGNVESVRRVTLEYMESFLDTEWSPGSFLPPEVVEMMVRVTLEVGREVAVCLNRKNRVVSISLGDERSVPIPEGPSRRSETRLSGIRLLHTHPNGTVLPSQVDLNSLQNLRLDAMVVLGVREPLRDASGDPNGDASCELSRPASCEAWEKAISGASATFLCRDAAGQLRETETEGPYHRKQLGRFDQLFARLEEIDRAAGDAYTVLQEEAERALLVGVVPEQREALRDPAEELRELKELAESAGALVVGSYTQRRAAPDARYYIGRGMAEDLALERQARNASLVIFDDELSASQIRNLEEILGTRVIDRTALILDIFAGRAKSREGRLQVELAQQKYRLPRLMGMGTSLSRLGGGIGTRGPGETKLQSDRRHINRRIHYLESQLREVSGRRQVLRKERKKKELPVIALVGYTNAGKSTLLNALCNADVFVEDKLFATLDPTVRKLATNDSRDFLLVDTVGFIRKLPHDLVEAFHSTLEETIYADLLLQVMESDCPNPEEQLEIVEQVLAEMGAQERPRFLVINKIDRTEGKAGFTPKGHFRRIYPVSALTGQGLEELREGMMAFFTKQSRNVRLLVPYSEGWVLPFLHQCGQVDVEEYTETGTKVQCRLPEEQYYRVKKWEMSDRG